MSNFRGKGIKSFQKSSCTSYFIFYKLVFSIGPHINATAHLHKKEDKKEIK